MKYIFKKESIEIPNGFRSLTDEEIAKDFVTSRTVDQLSPHHDSQFLAFSTEVLVRMNQGTIAVVLPLLP